jgi:hypothetical protein
MTGNAIHKIHADMVGRMRVAETLQQLDHYFAKVVETGSSSDVRTYSFVLRAAAQSSNSWVRSAVDDHLRQRDDFSQNMPMVDFVKKADSLDFEALGLFQSLHEGQVLVLARSVDAQIMLATVINNLVVEVDLNRFLRSDTIPIFDTRCFGEDKTQIVEEVMMSIFASAPNLLGLTVERDFHSRRLAPSWKSCPSLRHRGLLTGCEAASIGSDQAGAVGLRAASFVGHWRDIFDLDRPMSTLERAIDTATEEKVHHLQAQTFSSGNAIFAWRHG